MTLKLQTRQEVGRALWNRFVANHPGGWFWHTWEWCEYGLAYEPCEDRSVAVCDGRGEIVALSVWMVAKSNPAVVQCGGSHCPVPLIDCAKSESYLAPSLLQEHWRSAVTSDVRVILRGSPLVAPASIVVDSWVDVSWSSRVIDLTKSKDELHADVRSSYKPLIRQQARAFAFRVYDRVRVSEQERDELRTAHRLAAGVETRSAASWDHMMKWVEDGRALFVTSRPLAAQDLNSIDGYAYAIRYKNGAYYGSGVSGSAGHALQWNTMLALKRTGVQRYEIGWQGAACSKKEQDIEFFKRGFGGKDEKLQAYAVRVTPEGTS